MSNRLAGESSPYLLQHKENPVQWYPWGEEALNLAIEQDKPIFLSIGYSACHWCHVMEHESFESDSIAEILNENFVCIKVDREERPDLDQIYMNAVMALRNGQGGWPLSVFLTPQQEVFFGGTYWPPTSRVGMPGFDHVLHSVLDAYINRRDQVNEQSSQITAWLNQRERDESGLELDYSLLIQAATALHRHFDFQHGGFGAAPKFPHAMDLSLLIRLCRDWPDEAPLDKEVLLEMVEINLKKMAYGGIFDHLAGGFARYSVDEVWLVPHFEKMLYDNALLAGVYLDMFDYTKEPFYANIARKTLNYLLDYMTDAAGCFHSTEDADSEGVEGKFYVWSMPEVLDVLGSETGQRFCELYDVTPSGNFEGSNILNLPLSFQEFADKHGLEKESLMKEMRRARRRLLEVRDQRIRPSRDDKALVSWNALAIMAFSKASVLLNDPKYQQAARNAIDFIFENQRRDDGRLLHTWRNGTAKIDAFLDDYSFLINALIDLYSVGLENDLIYKAAELADAMIDHFAENDGAFYFTADDQESLIARQVSFQDSSIPSGNSMAALALIRLGRITGRSEWIEKANQTMIASADLLKRSPMASGQMLLAVHEALNEPQIFVLVSNSDEELELAKNRFLEQRYQSTLIISHFFDEESVLAQSPIMKDKSLVDGQTTLYVCSNGTCAAPIAGIDKVLTRITKPA